jgi:glycosyltransferase involved in cell wall biosynthesis
MKQIGYIIRSYPRLSQTFIVNEIQALEQLGLRLHLFPMTNPHEPIVQAQVGTVRAPVDYLEAATEWDTATMLGQHLRAALTSPIRYARALRYVLQRSDLDRDYHASSRYACFTQAVYLAHLLRREQQAGQPITHMHAHFAHDPTLIALLVKMLTGIPFSFTTHARDLVQIGQRALIERIEQASVVVTCSDVNMEYVNEHVPAPLRDKIRLIHHGVNLEGFQPVPREGNTAAPPLILSVGRLVEKKGFPDLVRACARLKQSGQRFRCEIYGEGPLSGELIKLIDSLGLAAEVTLAGACSQRELIPVFQQADVFALAPFVTADGDRDGIPNVLVEAMACGLPVVSTDVAGIPELVRHGQNGLLVAPHDDEGLAAALATLLDDLEQRRRLGAEARRTVIEGFDVRAAACQLATLFEGAEAQGLQPVPVAV